MNKFIGIRKAVSIALTSIIFLTSPLISLAQQKLMAELTVSGTVKGGEASFVTINGERAISGQSILSPAEIATPPQTNARITIAKIGEVEFGPNSRMNLTFDENRIAGVFTEGLLTVATKPQTSVNIQTEDGVVSVKANQPNLFFVDFVENGKTRVRPVIGDVFFNGVLVTAGLVMVGGVVSGGAGIGGGAGGAAGAGGAGGVGGGLGTALTVTLAVAAAAVASTVAAVTVANSEDEPVVSPTR